MILEIGDGQGNCLIDRVEVVAIHFDGLHVAAGRGGLRPAAAAFSASAGVLNINRNSSPPY